MKLAVVVSLLMATVSTQAEMTLDVQQVTKHVYALVGELDQRSPDNYANNATFGLVITSEGAVLIDPGGSLKGAKQIDRAIKSVTDKPVRVVINSGGQDHRWLGNSFFKAKGAVVIASEAAATDQRARTDYHFERLSQLLGESLEGTEASYPDQTFEGSMSLAFGGFDFELVHAGDAHTVGDIFIWLPQQRIMFSGDIVFTERMLGTGPARNTLSWLNVFERMTAYKPDIIIPGHGHAATPNKAEADTYDYLRFLRRKVAEVLEKGGDIQDAIAIDQSHFNYLKVFDRISRRNAQAVFTQMEFE